MSGNAVQTPNGELHIENPIIRRESILSSSSPQSDSLPIDFILVYDPTDRNKDNEIESNGDNPRKIQDTPAERRRKFEDYLRQKHGLILEPAVNKT